MASVSDPICGWTPREEPAFIVNADCPLHGDASLVAATDGGAFSVSKDWLAVHDGCTARANYPRKRRV
jgi:hypothetical protein